MTSAQFWSLMGFLLALTAAKEWLDYYKWRSTSEEILGSFRAACDVVSKGCEVHTASTKTAFEATVKAITTQNSMIIAALDRQDRLETTEEDKARL